MRSTIFAAVLMGIGAAYAAPAPVEPAAYNTTSTDMTASTVSATSTEIITISGSTTSAPSTTLSSIVPTNTAECKLEYGHRWQEYHLHIGRPFFDGAGCGKIEETLGDWNGGNVDGFQCKPDGDQSNCTYLHFAAGKPRDVDDNGDIMTALQGQYPGVQFSPNYTVDRDYRNPKAKARSGILADVHPLWPRGEVAKDDASCTVTPDLETNQERYDMIVGRPFIDGAGCGPIHKTLNQHHGDEIGSLLCEASGPDHTHLMFSAGQCGKESDNKNIIDALQEAYPMVPFQKNDICKSN